MNEIIFVFIFCWVWIVDGMFGLLFWPSPMYSRKFGARLRGRVMSDEIWLKQQAATLLKRGD